jgi:hypothetical protein
MEGVNKKGLFYPPTLITRVQTVSTVVVEEVSNLFVITNNLSEIEQTIRITLYLIT